MVYIFLVFQQENVKGPKEAHHQSVLPRFPVSHCRGSPWQEQHSPDSCHAPEMQKPLLTYFQAKALGEISHSVPLRAHDSPTLSSTAVSVTTARTWGWGGGS